MPVNDEYIKAIVAHNIRAAREKRKLSLDQVAQKSGVSKSMIGQIERGETNVSISTLWKIASGLHVPFTRLLENANARPVQVGRDTLEPVVSEDGLFHLFPFFPIDAERNFEILYLELEPGAESASDPHAAGTQEFLVVLGSELEVALGDKTYHVTPGSGMSFQADQPHLYRNRTGQPLQAVNIIYYRDI